MLPSIARVRLDAHGIARVRFRIPSEVVAWFGAVQAQEFAPARWGLGLRLHGRATDAEVAKAFDDGRILRTHVMRPTWHFVAAGDIHWIQELTAPRVQRIAAVYNRHLELDARTLSRGTAIVARALRDRNYLTRLELRSELQRRGLSISGQRLAHLMMHAELERVVCSGPRRDKQQTYALLSERVPKRRPLTRDEALSELSRRFFRSHGPATIRDFVWWSGLTTADAKRGLEMNHAKRVVVDEHTYWTVGRSSGKPRTHLGVELLPVYDEYLVAYRDRVAVPHLPAAVIGRGAAVTFQHALVIDGQVAGTWRTAASKGRDQVDVYPLRQLTTRERRLLAAAVKRYQRFVDQG